MHIALVAPGWPIGFASGIVTYVHYLRIGMLSIGHRVSVLAFTVCPSSDMEGVYRIDANWQSKSRRICKRLARREQDQYDWPSVMIADTINRLNRLDPIDVVEMEESFGWFDDVQRRTSVPVVVKLHGPAFLTQIEQTHPTPTLLRRIEREGTALNSAKFVFAPSSHTIAKTFERYGIKHLSPVVIPNPIAAPSQADCVWRGERCDPRLLLFVGRFDRIKGADLLLKSFRIMLESQRALRLVFVGPTDGTIDCDGQQLTMAACLEAWFGAELMHTVDVRGPMTAPEIRELRLRAVVTLVCSRWENQPNTALEAMAQGCPVVALAVGGINEVITDGQNGTLVEPGNVASLAEATLRMIGDLHQASAIGSNARAYVARVHAPSSVAQRTADFYARARRSPAPSA